MESMVKKIGGLGGGRRKPALAFTEHEAFMVASVLKSDRAIAILIHLTKAFGQMWEELATNETILRRLDEIRRSVLGHHQDLRDLYQKLMPLLRLGRPEKRRIGFGGREWKSGVLCKLLSGKEKRVILPLGVMVCLHEKRGVF